MTRPVRLLLWLLAAIVALLVVVFGALAVFVSQLDINRYKPEAIAWVKANKNRTLTIDGPLALSVFPRLELKLSGVKLSEAGKPDAFAEVDAARLSLHLLPLLRRQIEVDRVEAQGVRVAWRRNAAGVSNIDDLIGTDKKADATPAEPAVAPAGPVRFDVAGIQLAEVRLRVEDEKAKLRGNVEVVSLKAGRIAEGQETPIEFDLKLGLEAPELGGELKGKTRLRFDLRNGGPDAALALQLAGFDARYAGRAAGMQIASSSVSLDSAQWAPAEQRLQLAKLVASLKASRDGKPLELELNWPRLDVRGDTLQGAPLAGSVAVEVSGLAVKANFASGEPAGNFKQIKLPGLKLDVDAQRGGASPLQAKGQLRTDLALQTEPPAATLSQLKAELQAGVAGGTEVLSLEGSASASASQAQWQLQGRSKGPGHDGPLASSGSARFGGGSPAVVEAKVELPALDLDQLRGPPAAAAASGAPAGDIPVDLSAAGAFRGTLDASVAGLTANKIRFTDLRVTLKGDGNRLTAAPFATKVWGGTMQGSAEVLPASQRIGLKAQAQSVRIEQALKDLSGRDTVEGTGNLTLDVTTAGRTVGQLRSALAGKANVALRDGAVKGVNLAALMRQAKAALTMKTDEVQKAKSTEKTDFSEITASFDIANGVARNTDLNAKSPYLRVTGGGAIDIGRGSLDYTARTTVTASSAGQGGEDLSALKGVELPVRFTGPFDGVQYAVQWSAVTASVAKQAIASKLGDPLREKLGLPPAGGAASQPAANKKDALKNSLKGLFR